MFPESLVAARKLLEEITPLQTDCGLVCGGACCQTHPGEETGMLLFPGEAEMYRGEKEKKKLIVRPRMMSLRRRHSHGHG